MGQSEAPVRGESRRQTVNPCTLPPPRQSFTRQLTFKNWKSLLHIHVLKGTRPERITCLLYGRLITIIMLNILYGYAAWYASAHLQREVSAHKLINWMKRKGRFAQAIHQGGGEVLLDDLIAALPKMLCKQKRKRRTSHQLLEDQVPYMDRFLEDDVTLLDQTA